MSARRIAIVVSGVAVVALLAVYSLGLFTVRDKTVAPPPEVVRETADNAKKGAGDEAVDRDAKEQSVSLDTASQRDSASEPTTAAGTSLTYERPPSWFEANIGRDYDDCRSKRLAMDVCKHWFEPRDEKWAWETERKLIDLVAATPMLRFRANHTLPNVECRTTWCRIFFDVDVPALIEQRRAAGQWDENSKHKFADATLGRGWAKDRIEELRLGLVMSGLIDADAEVEWNAVVPVSGERDGFLDVNVHRCPKRNESCGPR